MENKKLFIIIIIFILGGVLIVNLSANKQKTTIRTNATDQEIDKSPSSSQKNNPSETQSSYSDGISLQIIEPQNNKTVTNPSITIVGKTAAGAEIFINDIELRANGSGDFSTQITLDEGENIIFVAANDQDGNSAEQEVLVTYEPQN